MVENKGGWTAWLNWCAEVKPKLVRRQRPLVNKTADTMGKAEKLEHKLQDTWVQPAPKSAIKNIGQYTGKGSNQGEVSRTSELIKHTWNGSGEDPVYCLLNYRFLFGIFSFNNKPMMRRATHTDQWEINQVNSGQRNMRKTHRYNWITEVGLIADKVKSWIPSKFYADPFGLCFSCLFQSLTIDLDYSAYSN